MLKATFGVFGFVIGLTCFLRAYISEPRMHHDLGALFVGGGVAAMMGGAILFFNAIAYD